MGSNGELHRSEELALREKNGDAAAATIPRLRLTVEHPFNLPAHAVNQLTDDLFFFFPSGCLWSDSAQGFGQVRGAAVANSCLHYENMITMVFHMADIVGEGQNENGLPIQVVSWTVVPSRNAPERVSGYLVRCTYQLKGSAKPTPATVLHQHIISCDNQHDKWRKENRTDLFSGKSMPAFRRLTMDAYICMCDYYKSTTVGDRSVAFQKFEDQSSNAYYPSSVFSLPSALALMRNHDADPEFTRADSYLQNDTALFPRDGECTWGLSPKQLNYVNMQKTYLPHVVRDEYMYKLPEFDSFQRNAGVRPRTGDPVTDAALEEEEMATMDESMVGLSYEQRLQVVKTNYARLACATDTDPSVNLDTFKKTVCSEKARARRAAGTDKAEFFKLWRQAQLRLLRSFFSSIFTTDETADVGDALHALAAWKDKFLTTRFNFCMPIEKRSSNLSRFGDFQCREAEMLEVLWSINTAHSDIKSLRLACMHVYFYSPFHCHTLLAGDAGGGKSKALDTNMDRMIPDTNRDLGNESAKAKMTPGRATDLAVETLEDIPPSTLGVTTGAVKTASAQSTNNTDGEAFLKYRLTKGRVRSVYKAVVNGVHTRVDVDSRCNTVMLAGSNMSKGDLPKSIASRFNVIQFAIRQRTTLDGGDSSIFGKQQQAANQAFEPMKHDARQYAHRTQCLQAIISLLCWLGVFPMPNLEVPVLLWSRALAMAQKKGLHETDEVRHFERLRFHCEAAIVEDVVDRVFDSGLILDPSKPFDEADLLHAERHLVGYSEHAAFTMGLLQHQWENPIGQSFERWLRADLLKELIRNNHVGAQHRASILELAEQQRYHHYYVCSFDNTLGAGTDTDRAHNLQQMQLVQKLARRAHEHLDPRPALEEVKHAIKSLCSLHLEVPNKHCGPLFPGATRRVPALTFTRDGEVMVAEHLINSYEHTRLQSCLKEVMSHAHTRPKNMIYGRTLADVPYVWKVMKTEPRPDNLLRMDMSSHFSDSLVTSTRALLRGVNASWRPNMSDPEGMAAEDLDDENEFRSHFSDTSHKDVDMDLDQWAAMLHAERIGLKYHYPDEPPADAPDWDTSPESFTEAVLAADNCDLDKLVVYPRNVPEVQGRLHCKKLLSDAKLEDRRRAAVDPEYKARFSLKAMIGQRRPRDDNSQSVVPMSVDASAADNVSMGNEEEEARPRRRRRLYDPTGFVEQEDELPPDHEDDDAAFAAHDMSVYDRPHSQSQSHQAAHVQARAALPQIGAIPSMDAMYRVAAGGRA